MRDTDVRQAVLALLEAHHCGDPDTWVVEEMGVWANSVRIDIAVLNGELSGFELKSDRDTLERLPLQAELYSRVFDRLTLVVGERHFSKALPIVPSWWGITVATMNDKCLSLESVRHSELNPNRDAYLIAHLLRKDEALTLLGRYGLAQGWRNRAVGQVYQRLVEQLPAADLFDGVRELLKFRQRTSRQNGSHQLDVPIHRNAYPKRQALGFMRAVGDLVDDVISPTSPPSTG